MKKPRVAYPLRLFLDCSTAHLTPATRGILDRATSKRIITPRGGRRPMMLTKRKITDPPIYVCPTPYGWFVYADEEPGDNTPADLAAVMREARRRGAEFILFDADADTAHLPELPTYPEE